MVAFLGELVSKREPVLLNECLESLHRSVVRVQEDLSQGDNLQGGRKGYEVAGRKQTFFLLLLDDSYRV